VASSANSALLDPEPPRRLGSETPRIWTKPLRRLTPKTSAGFACIEFAELVLGIVLLPWQRWCLIHALELLPDGSYRFRTVVVLVGRQNGKSTLLQVLSLWRMYVDGAPLVIGTAQNLDVAEEQWEAAVEMAEGIPELADEIAQVSKVNGKKFLKLVGRQRYKVAAASRRGGRGLTGDLVLMDELREHQNWLAWAAVTKTTITRRLAQVWCTSNAGDAASVVLGYLRLLAHIALGNPDGLDLGLLEAGGDPDSDDDEDVDSLGIFEWSAPPGCDKWDRDGWAQANPALGHEMGDNGLTERAIASAVRTDPEDVVRCEVLCQWVDIPDVEQVISLLAWARCEEPDAKRDGYAAYAIDVAPDGASAAVAASDGLTSIVLEHGPGIGWVTGKMAEILADHPGPVFLDPRSPAGALLVDLHEATLETVDVSAAEHAQACGGLLAAVLFEPNEGEPLRFHHTGQSHLDAAVRGATRRPYSDGGWVWSRRSARTDISPLVAVTLARWGRLQMQPPQDADFFTI
jgi:hypothetical protein